MSKYNYEERQNIDSLDRKVIYLRTKIERNKKYDMPTSFDEVELRSLLWHIEIREQWFSDEHGE